MDPGTYHVIELFLSTKFLGSRFSNELLDVDSKTGIHQHGVEGFVFWALCSLELPSLATLLAISLRKK